MLVGSFLKMLEQSQTQQLDSTSQYQSLDIATQSVNTELKVAHDL